MYIYNNGRRNLFDVIFPSVSARRERRFLRDVSHRTELLGNDSCEINIIFLALAVAGTL